MALILSLNEGGIKSTRDYQRQRVYDAERKSRDFVYNAASRNLPMVEWNALQAYVASIVNTNWFWLRFKWSNISVGPGKGHRRATGGHGHIELPKWARSPLVICHELAHAVGDWGEKHGPRFCESFLYIVYHHMGEASYMDLRSCFISNDVDFIDPIMAAPLTTEQIAKRFQAKPKRKANPAAIEALRKYREAKKMAADTKPLDNGQ